MKKLLVFLLVGATAISMFTACANENSGVPNENGGTPPSSVDSMDISKNTVDDENIAICGNSVSIFKGVITELDGDIAIVTPNDDQEHILSSGDKVKVNLSISDTLFSVDDEIVVYYTGEIMESYPLQIDVTEIRTIDEFENNTTDSDTDATIEDVAVNIEGKIVSVSDDGMSFVLDTGKTVIITDETEMGINTPTSVPKDEQLFDDKFTVGNMISGFTLDESPDTIIAHSIYSNWS